MIARAGLLVLAAVLLAGCGKEQAPAVGADCRPAVDLAELGLGVQTLKKGYGRAACVGDRLTVHTTGWLYDADEENGRGEKFWSSYDPPGNQFSFVLGEGRVIRGWDLGLPGMLIGETRQLTIPAKLGYGGRGSGPVPPNATLVFEIELFGAEGPGDDAN